MEKFFSLEWFKEKIESSVDRVLDARIASKIDQLIDNVDESIPNTIQKPYLHVKLVNDTLTVVLNNGDIVIKPSADEIHYARIMAALTEEEVLAVIYDKVVTEEKAEQVEEAERVTKILEGFEKLKDLKDFTVQGSCVYLTGTSRTIPPLLVEQFSRVVNRHSSEHSQEEIEELLLNDEEYQSLKNFFMWCCLNPRAEVADQLYNFLTTNSFRITKQGFFVALRNVVTVSGNTEDNELMQFVSNAYNKIKAVWKKSPKDYRVVQNRASYSLELKASADTDGTILGDLVDLYNDMPNMVGNRYTDAHTQTFDIRVGRPVNMPMNECSWSTADCMHAGLHFTADQIHYVGCGDTSVLVLINPMKVVGIGTHKGRCYEYLPIMTVPREEATEILHDVDFDTLQLDEDYAIRELEGLAEKAKAGFTAETGKYNFNLPSMSSAEINSIVLSLGEMKKTITKRVSLIE